jgi:von Willebrand factor type A C-terminal domain/von Willebrand factor type A domain
MSSDSGFPLTSGSDRSAGGLTRAFAGLLTVLVLPWVMGARTARLLCRGTGRAAGFARRSARRVGTGLGRLVGWAGALLAVCLRFAVGAARILAAAIGAVANRVGAGLARVAAVVVLAAAVVARATADVARAAAAAARPAARAAAAAARAAAAVARTAARAAAAVARPAARAAAAVARPAARAAAAVARAAVVFLVRAGTVLVTPVRRWLPMLFVGAVASGRAVAGAMVRRAATMRQGALVAIDTARHRASMASSGAGKREPAWLKGLSPAVAPNDDAGSYRGPEFTIETSHNDYLAPGETQVDAIISISVTDPGRGIEAPEMVEVLMLDCSASMGHPWDKIRAARMAAIGAIDALRDGVWFAVVRGGESAEVVYPREEGLVRVSPETREAAARVIRKLQPVGGTAIGRWLLLARDLMALRPGAIHHAILVTDGKDEDETDVELDAAIAACRGRFQCDCRGVGTDWAVAELRKVSSALLGSVDIIAHPALMEEEFRRIVGAAMERTIEASLCVWIPRAGRINCLRMVSPAIVDLTPDGRPVDSLITEYPTGAWAIERRAYYLSVELPAAPAGLEMLAARVRLTVGGTVVAEGRVKTKCTEDRLLSGSVNPDVAHYRGQLEMSQAIQDGLRFRRSEDEDTATEQLTRAVHLAAGSGNAAVADLLARVVDVDDDGSVRLRHNVEKADEMALDTRSSRTVQQSARSFRTGQWADGDGSA